MRYLKEILKIIFVLQILSCALASYGHPNAEVIDFGTDQSHDAISYQLANEDSIPSKTVTQARKSYINTMPVYIPRHGHRNSRSVTVTRFYTDENGHKVTQTTSFNKPNTVLSTDDFTTELSFPITQPGIYKTFAINSYVNEPIETSSQAAPASNYHRTETTTYTEPNGEKHVPQTTSTKLDNILAFKKPEPWPSKTWNLPVFPSSSTTDKPKLHIEQDLPIPKPLLNSEGFLQTQNDPTTKKTIHINIEDLPNLEELIPTQNDPTTKRIIHINIDDLPATAILYNGKPANERILKNLPPNLRPKLNTDIRYLDTQIQEVLKEAGNTLNYVTNINQDKNRIRYNNQKAEDLQPNSVLY